MEKAENVEAGRLPNFLIIGAAKSGTTTLRASLAAHPQAFCAKEIHFFNLHYGMGLDWYRSHFKGAEAGLAVGEKCPAYMHNPSAMERISHDLPDVKLIAMLRNPVDRAYSHYWHERRLGNETLSFAEAVETELDRVGGSEEDGSRLAYVQRGRYLPQLERVCDLFPREKLLVLLFEDLQHDPRGMFAEVCRFLGIDTGVLPPQIDHKFNPYRVHKPEWLWQLMERRQIWRFIPRDKRVRLARRMERVVAYESMDPSVHRRLQDMFADDNAALALWLGRDLSSWAT